MPRSLKSERSSRGRRSPGTCFSLTHAPRNHPAISPQSPHSPRRPCAKHIPPAPARHLSTGRSLTLPSVRPPHPRVPLHMPEPLLEAPGMQQIRSAPRAPACPLIVSAPLVPCPPMVICKLTQTSMPYVPVRPSPARTSTSFHRSLPRGPVLSGLSPSMCMWCLRVTSARRLWAWGDRRLPEGSLPNSWCSVRIPVLGILPSGCSLSRSRVWLPSTVLSGQGPRHVLRTCTVHVRC
ncbi:hypothetical protein C2E23DRAFT_93027 [Lenzites betulinus]|nr:hypothetical protein C2E23DRAFT_93027 [Lenzites betulinus]